MKTFDQLFEEHRPQLWQRALKLAGGCIEDAEDVLAECHYRAWDGYGGYDPSQLFGPWVFRVLTSAAGDFARKKAREVVTAPLEEARDLGRADTSAPTELCFALIDALDGLPEVFKRDLWAAACGESADTSASRKRCSVARKFFRRQLGWLDTRANRRSN